MEPSRKASEIISQMDPSLVHHRQQPAPIHEIGNGALQPDAPRIERGSFAFKLEFSASVYEKRTSGGVSVVHLTRVLEHGEGRVRKNHDLRIVFPYLAVQRQVFLRQGVSAHGEIENLDPLSGTGQFLIQLPLQDGREVVLQRDLVCICLRRTKHSDADDIGWTRQAMFAVMQAIAVDADVALTFDQFPAFRVRA